MKRTLIYWYQVHKGSAEAQGCFAQTLDSKFHFHFTVVETFVLTFHRGCYIRPEEL